jgi:hypothetical protein
MAEQATPTPAKAPAGAGAEDTTPQAELARSREEVLRLRDLLIAKEAELGALRGRVAEMEGGAAPLAMIGLRLRALLPNPLRAILSRLLGRPGKG